MIKYDQIWSNMIKWHHQTDIKQISNSYQTAKQLKTYAPGQDFYPALVRNVSHAWSLGVVPRPGVAEPSLPSHSSSFWIPSGYVKIAIENDHRNSGFSHWKWWFFHSYVKLPEGMLIQFFLSGYKEGGTLVRETRETLEKSSFDSPAWGKMHSSACFSASFRYLFKSWHDESKS